MLQVAEDRGFDVSGKELERRVRATLVKYLE